MSLLIDFGTSALRLQTLKSDEVVIQASVVAQRVDGEVVAGDSALEMIGRAPQSIRISEPVIAGVINDSESAVALLKYVIQKFLPKHGVLRMPVKMALPANLTTVEQRGLEEVVKLAGARQVEFVHSLVAAAAGADLSTDQPSGSLVVNLGAGVTEVGLLSMRGIVESRRLPRGGRQIDDHIIEVIRQKHTFIVGRRAVQALKHRLASDDADKFVVTGRSLANGLPAKIEIERSLVWEPLEAYYAQVTELVRNTIEHCPPELVGDVVDKGVVLVGGGALTFGAEEELKKRIDVGIRVAENPQTAVIRGLAKLAKSGLGQTPQTFGQRALQLLKSS